MENNGTLFGNLSRPRINMLAFALSLPLAIILLGCFLNTSPIYASTRVTFVLYGYGTSKSVHFYANPHTTSKNGTPLASFYTCSNAAPPVGAITTMVGKGEFSLSFYDTTDCTGKVSHRYRFSAPNTGGPVTVTCNSDTDCKETNG
jgi:hypothetical protein